MEGAFGEFAYLPDSDNSIVTENWVRYTANHRAAIYFSDSSSCQITKNTIETLSKGAFVGANCNSFIISNNTVVDMTGSRTGHGIMFYSSGGVSTYNVMDGNTITGWRYGITANRGSQDSTITNNVFSNCTVGTLVTGSFQMYGNVYNGASDSPGNDTTVYFIGFLTLLAVAIVALVLMARRKKKRV